METKLVVKKELTEKIQVETHEGGIGQDDSENKQKVKESYRATSKKIIDPTRMSLLLRNLMWLKQSSWQKTIQVNQRR